MSIENQKPKIYKLEVGESTGKEPKIKLSTDNNPDLTNIFSQFIWVHDLSHPIIAAFLDSIGIVPVRLGSKINEIFTVVINNKFWKSFISLDPEIMKQKDYYLEELAENYCKDLVSQNSKNYENYLQNPEVVQTSEKLTELTKLIILLTNLMEKYDNEQGGIVKKFEEIDTLCSEEGKDWNVDVKQINDLELEISKYEFLVGIISGQQVYGIYSLNDILKEEEIDGFINPYIKKWSKKLLEIIKNKAKSRNLDFKKLSLKEKYDLIDFDFVAELHETLANKKLELEKLEKPTFELTAWRDREVNPPKALEKYAPIVAQINKIIESIPKWADLL